MKNDMPTLPIVKASTIINDYGINSTGKEFNYDGKTCVVCLVNNPKYKLGIGEKTSVNEHFVKVIAYIEFE